MKFALVMLLGFGLVLILPGKTLVLAVLGAVAGVGYMIAEAIWPKPKPAYIDPVNRPKASTPVAAYVAAIAVAVISGLLAIFAWNVVIARLPASGAFGIYLAAAGLGIALGMALMARRSSAAHNRWLASMAPRSELEF
jgi:hypothetical protein